MDSRPLGLVAMTAADKVAIISFFSDPTDIVTSHTPSKCPLCNATGEFDFSSKDLMFQGNQTYSYHRCISCNLIYQHPIPSDKEIADFYPESYTVYKQPCRTHFTPLQLSFLKQRHGYKQLKTGLLSDFFATILRREYVNDIVDYVENGLALDIGCGNGEYLLRLKSIGWKCKGVEFNDKAVSICLSNGLDIFQGDLKSAKFGSSTFDLVTAHHLLEHVPDPNELFSEISRLLKPGGRLLIRTPNAKALGRSWFGTNWYANDVPRHLYLYSKGNLTKLAQGHGLTPVKIHTIVKSKLLLKSYDYKSGNTGKPSKKRKLRKWLSSLYIPLARYRDRGDEIFGLFKKT